MDNQRTIKSKISLEGAGLHSGENVKAELLQAPVNTGINFVRRDISSCPVLKVALSTMANPQTFPRRTSIGFNDVYVHTIEHVMAALCLLRIDNIQINIWGEEMPGLDGSAKVYVDKIRDVGTIDQEASRQYLVIREPLWVEEGSSSISIFPYPYLRVSYALKYENPFIGSGFAEVILDGDALNPQENVYEARTFCLEEEVAPLLELGLGKGATYENTLVVCKDGIRKNALRFPDELVKHKILDLIGDLYAAGPFKGHIVALRSGHSLNIKLLEKLAKYKERITNAGIASASSYVPKGNEINAEEILKILPHRYPFLLVDRIVHLEKGKKAVGIKNVSFNEQFFQGHFPSKPIMPGVLIIEAMAQVGGVLMLACEENKGKLAYFMAANNVKFRKTVEPGDQLRLEVDAGKIKSKTGTVVAKAFVDNKLVAEAELMFSLTTS